MHRISQHDCTFIEMVLMGAVAFARTIWRRWTSTDEIVEIHVDDCLPLAFANSIICHERARSNFSLRRTSDSTLGTREHVFQGSSVCSFRSWERRSLVGLYLWGEGPMPPNIMNESLALADACFELARVLKWSKDGPASEMEIGGLAERLNAIAMERVHHRDTLGRDVPVVARAVAYLSQAHAIPPMGDGTEGFGHILDAVLEVARPNSGLDGQAREFLKDMRDGIAVAETI